MMLKQVRFHSFAFSFALTAKPCVGFPWGDAPPGTIVCDVAGGLGHMTMHIANLHPNINVMVQDLEETVNQAIGYWNGFGPELVEADRVDFLPFDFFKEPPIPDCDYYYVSALIAEKSQKLIRYVPCFQLKHIM